MSNAITAINVNEFDKSKEVIEVIDENEDEN